MSHYQLNQLIISTMQCVPIFVLQEINIIEINLRFILTISMYTSSNGNNGDYASASITVEDNNNDDNIYIATEIDITLSDGSDNNFELYQGISNTIITNIPSLSDSSGYNLNFTNCVKFGLIKQFWQ